MSDISDKKILICGMGISGKGVASMIYEAHGNAALYDANENLDKEALIKDLKIPADTLIITGTLHAKDLENIDALVISPGISVNAEFVQMAKSLGKEILGEVEAAFRLSKGRLIAITGTNGKTTTTALTGEIMKAAFPDVHVVGNIGKSYAAAANDTTNDSITVAEISSFQLETVKYFHPEISAILNLTPDHLDRHGTFENYALTKLRIAENQTESDFCVINYDDEYLRRLTEDIKPEIVYFSRLNKLSRGVCLDNDEIVIVRDGVKTAILRKDEMNLLGDHNVENVMAAIAIATSFGVEGETIARVIKSFKAVEHRIEYVCTRNGVSFYNDSKGTNTDAASKAVSSMTLPTVLIAGGYDKGADFTEWIKGFKGRVKFMILIGETAEKIKETAKKCGFENVITAGTLQNAVQTAKEVSKAGDVVLLSPACASWDQFKNYEQRGDMFKELVRAIPENII